MLDRTRGNGKIKHKKKKHHPIEKFQLLKVAAITEPSISENCNFHLIDTIVYL